MWAHSGNKICHEKSSCDSISWRSYHVMYWSVPFSIVFEYLGEKLWSSCSKLSNKNSLWCPLFPSDCDVHCFPLMPAVNKCFPVINGLSFPEYILYQLLLVGKKMKKRKSWYTSYCCCSSIQNFCTAGSLQLIRAEIHTETTSYLTLTLHFLMTIITVQLHRDY